MKEKLERFIDKWSCLWVTNKNKAKLDAAFERELKELLDAEYNQALEEFKITVLGFENPYSLLSVIDHLVFAAEYLLHVKNYDGYKYEELNQSVRRAKEVRQSILQLKKQITMKALDTKQCIARNRWKFDESCFFAFDESAFVEEDSAGCSIAEVFNHSSADSYEITMANARLIAAAPELLEALQGMLNIVEETTGVAGYHLNGNIAYWGEFPEVEKAQSVINKALGKE